jgi:hypothetical protein
MEKIKVSILLFFATISMVAQTVTVKGVTLSYDKNTDTMTLTVPESLVTSEDPNFKKEIEIFRDAIVTMEVNGKKQVASKPFYTISGRSYEGGSEFVYSFSVKSSTIYESLGGSSCKFIHPPKGEFILNVKDVGDNKIITNAGTDSIIIN